MENGRRMFANTLVYRSQKRRRVDNTSFNWSKKCRHGANIDVNVKTGSVVVTAKSTVYYIKGRGTGVL